MLEIFAKIVGVWSGAKNRGKEWEKILGCFGRAGTLIKEIFSNIC